MTETRQQEYLHLIDQLLHCPNGEEPQILDAHPDLLDAGLVQILVQVAMMFTHENNQEGAKFLVHVARELSKQLGLYPELSTQETG